MPDHTTPAAEDPPSEASQQPIGTPPGGGRWAWDATAAAWVSLDPVPEPTQE